MISRGTPSPLASPSTTIVVADAGTFERVNLPDPSLTATSWPIMTGTAGNGPPVASTSSPEISVVIVPALPTVMGTVSVFVVVPSLTRIEKARFPTWPGAGENVSSPVTRLNIMLAGSGCGMIVYVSALPVSPAEGTVTSSVLPAATL
jgi:hypothetical protein